MKKILLSLSIIASVLSQAQVVTSLAGAGTQGSVNATGPAASFNSPSGTCVDAAGNVYVADYANNLIRKITSAGVVTTLAGSGAQGTVNATGTAASFFNPFGVCVDGAGNVFVADQDNHLIRKITPAGVVTTFAGQVGVAGVVDGTGTGAGFSYPRGICIDGLGNLYVTDYLGHTIRKITPAGVVTTIAGQAGISGAIDATGTAATFNRPNGICLDFLGNLYVADRSNHKIRKITSTGIVTTFAGSGSIGSANGTGPAASFNLPLGVAADAGNNIYVADNNNQRIRKITSAQVVSYFAGSGSVGAVDATGTSASFNGPTGISADMMGNLFVADQFNHKIRRISNPTAGITELPNAVQSIVYPNPATDVFFIELKATSKVTVTNSLGQIIIEQSMNAGKQSISLQNYAKGIYFVSVLQNEKTQTIKLVKE